MPEISPDLAEFATCRAAPARDRDPHEHDARRVTARVGRAVDGRDRPHADRRWTAGVKPHPVVAELGLPLDGGGRIVTDRYCKVPGRPGVWAIGDAAAVPDPANKGKPSPPTAQHVMRQAQGRRRQRRGRARPASRSSRPFRYRTLGVFVDMGRNQAVASTLGIKWRGFPAWFLARTYHLALMPGQPRRARLVDRLDRRPAVRPRLRRARPARPSAALAARRPSGGAGGRAVRGRRRRTRRRRRRSPRRPSGRAGTASSGSAGRARSTRTGAPSLPSQMRSSGKRIVNVWTERQRGRCSA